MMHGEGGRAPALTDSGGLLGEEATAGRTEHLEERGRLTERLQRELLLYLGSVWMTMQEQKVPIEPEARAALAMQYAETLGLFFGDRDREAQLAQLFRERCCDLSVDSCPLRLDLFSRLRSMDGIPQRMALILAEMGYANAHAFFAHHRTPLNEFLVEQSVRAEAAKATGHLSTVGTGAA